MKGRPGNKAVIKFSYRSIVLISRFPDYQCFLYDCYPNHLHTLIKVLIHHVILFLFLLPVFVVKKVHILRVTCYIIITVYFGIKIITAISRYKSLLSLFFFFFFETEGVNATHFLDILFLLFDLYYSVYLKECQNHFAIGFKRI